MRSLLWVGVVLLAGGVAVAADKPDLPAMQQEGGASAGTQVAKDQGGRYTLRTGTRLVVLDVMVKDASGNPVRGLKKGDFHVIEAKRPQTILNFEAAESHMVSPAVTVHSTAELDKEAPEAPVNILVLDEFDTRYEEMAKGRYYLKHYLETQPARLAVPTMLVAAGLDDSEKQHNLRVLSDYTQDRQALLEALQHYFPRYPFGSESMGTPLNKSRVGERFGMTFGTMERIAEAARSHKGHKNLIWIGQGFPADVEMPVATDEMWNAMQECVNTLREARMTLYSVLPQGGTKYTRAMDSTAMPFFFDMVEQTGGKANYRYNDVDVQIGESLRDGADFYTLSYRPEGSSLAPEKFRNIVVTVDRPGVTVAANRGYLQPGPGLRHLESAQGRRVFDLMNADTSQMVYDGVPIKVTRSAADADFFAVEVDPSALVWDAGAEDGQRQAHLALVASTFDKHGRELKRVAKKMQLATPAGSAAKMEIALPVEFPHDGKAVRARFVVRVEETERMGSADVSLKQ